MMNEERSEEWLGRGGMNRWLQHASSEHPDAVALRAGDAFLTHARLRDAAAATAAMLHDRFNVHPGDCVELRMPASMEFAVAFHALLHLGAIITPAPAEDAVDAQIINHGPCISVTRTPAVVMRTSGSTGQPKQVLLTMGNFEASARASALNLGVEADDDWLCTLPVHHVGGLSILTRSAIQGTCASLLPRFDTAAVMALLTGTATRPPVTQVSLVPTMLQRLLDDFPRWDATSTPRLRTILLGGAPAAMALLHEAATRGLPVLTSYGMTESCSQIAALNINDSPEKRGSAGRPLPGARIEIRDENGAALPAGITGQVWIAGTMLGRSEARMAEHTEHEWLQTGDIGLLDSDGYLWIEARREDLIITGGENVRPAEVEAALLAHPLVAEAAVVGVPDAEWGQRVAAMVVLRSGADPDAAIGMLDAHCRSLLPGFKIPRRWTLVAALPMKSGMKVDREAVRARCAVP